ncbi:monooxygenase [Sporocytophaga myxococcoides]|uniref:Monooxygenase n=1 Tax=Sporocytophaga myxococcoides TaxID=153721 RepID=A0A098LKA4_9BACT|nr:FAD-dependent monooxygenase [Sporocytophaga myxococcoides]GAL87400.1 monooxygenase [Sporocytophaga myxococcoides]
MKIAIIGGGIGGLTTALALKQIGKEVVIYESASEIKPVGAGIVMANNAMQVFKKLGVCHKIEEAGCKISNIRITDAQLNTLSLADLTRFENKYNVYNVAIHRADLQKILANEIGFENIQLSKRLSGIDKGNEFKLTFEDGTVVHADVLIGADGINSVVRKQLFGTGNIRHTGQKCWRGVGKFDWFEKYNNEALEAWGKGKRFGFVKISDKNVYWYAVINESLMNDNVTITELFKEFHPKVVKIISGTPKAHIHFSDIIDLEPITNWSNGKACLIGDAAHATTPNMGQGACQAVEDAFVIGKLFAQDKSAEEVFSQYEKLRRTKAHFIVNTSWKIGELAHLENNAAIWFRNALVKITPDFFNEKQLDRVFDIEYNV